MCVLIVTEAIEPRPTEDECFVTRTERVTGLDVGFGVGVGFGRAVALGEAAVAVGSVVLAVDVGLFDAPLTNAKGVAPAGLGAVEATGEAPPESDPIAARATIVPPPRINHFRRRPDFGGSVGVVRQDASVAGAAGGGSEAPVFEVVV